MKNKKGFTLIELLTVIAILAVILLISIPIILGVLDNARKNSFKNQVLLYVEALKQQTGMALMGSGYSELKSVDNSFYAPTNDSDNKLVRVSVANLNKVMDNVALTNDTDKYFYVEYTDTGYNYYIGEGVRKEGEFSTTCVYATGNEACTSKTYNEESINLINSKVFNLVHITRNDVAASSSGTSNNNSGNNNTTPIGDTTAPTVSASVDGTSVTLTLSDETGISAYCISISSNSDSCSWQETTGTSVTEENMSEGTYYAFAKDTSDNISTQATFTIQNVELMVALAADPGDEVTLATYKWHVIGENDTKIWLLMDAFDGNGTSDSNRQIDDMAHYTTAQTYSWDTSLIRTYLNGTFYNSLPTEVKNKIVSTNICKDSSINSSTVWPYGGYTSGEIYSLQASDSNITCSSGYTSDKVRLITPAEYYNLTSYYTTTSYPITYTGSTNDNRKGKIPQVSYITRLSSSSDSWLYVPGMSYHWWTTGALGITTYNGTYNARNISNGNFSEQNSTYSRGVRPVIVLQK